LFLSIFPILIIKFILKFIFFIFYLYKINRFILFF